MAEEGGKDRQMSRERNEEQISLESVVVVVVVVVVVASNQSIYRQKNKD